MKNLFYIFLIFPFYGLSQSGGVHKDAKQITAWVTDATIYRGSQHIGTDSLQTTTGEYTSAIGKADGDVVSLGDGGHAIVTFKNPIQNNIGNDFAVFENSFVNSGGYFLELAFVEVSSDGINFIRFPALSKTKSKISSFGSIDPDSVTNLAGKHIAGYGTPFDLEELKDSTNIDINAITHIKIIDVIGDSIYSSKDSKGNIIYDPFPTPFNAGGFDLDAVAVLDESIVGFEEITEKKFLFKNPVSNNITLFFDEDAIVSILNNQGKLVYNKQLLKGQQFINMSYISNGVYVLLVKQGSIFYQQKFLKL